MQIFDFDAAFQQIVGQILGHFLSERGDQRTFVPCHAVFDFGEQVIDLPFHRPHVDLRID